jgi:hypothetical protein
MPRELNPERNVLEVTDHTTGETGEVYFRMPSNEERVKYGNKMMVRKGKQVFYRRNLLSLNLEFGKLLVTGFKKGLFAVNGQLIASDPGDPDYDPNWLRQVEAGAPEYLTLVARTAFNSVSAGGKEENQIEGFEKIEELPEDNGGGSPLSGSSGGISNDAPQSTGSGV